MFTQSGMTPRVLVGALRNLPTHQIAWMIEASIDELDRRSGDPDLENDPDKESED
jgi:hypothetical protein